MESYPYVYKEETPRGGVHYLIYTDSDAFKYRISDRLEVIVNSMVTFYGNGEFSTQEPTILTRSDFEDCTEVGHEQLEIVEVSLQTQQKVVSYLDEISLKIEKIKQIQKEKMQSLKALKASILDQAFKGEL